MSATAARQIPKQRIPKQWIRAANLGLVILGVLATHESAYALSATISDSSTVAPDHSHQALLWSLGVPLALWALIGFIVRQAANIGIRTTIRPSRLGAAIALGFLAQETVEALVHGHGLGAVAANNAVIIGLIIGPLVAVVLLRLLHLTNEIVAIWLTASPLVIEATLLHWNRHEAISRTRSDIPGDPRGPPFALCIRYQLT